MKTKIILTAIALFWGVTGYAAPKESVSATQPTVSFRGEELPVFAPPRTIKAKRSVPPEYPTRERKDGVEGKTLLMVLVGTDGKVLEAEVLSSSPTAAFGEAGRVAVAQWLYPSVVRNGKPTKFLVQVPLSFGLSEE